MTRLSEFVIARRRWIVLGWVLLTILGVYATGRLSDRWFESFSIPGYEAYEANQRALDTFGSGAQPPLVVVFQTDQGDVTKSEGLDGAIERTAAAVPGSRASSYFTTGSDAYVSSDRRTTFAEIYPPGQQEFTSIGFVERARAALRDATPAGVSANLTGRDPLNEDVGGSEGTGRDLLGGPLRWAETHRHARAAVRPPGDGRPERRGRREPRLAPRHRVRAPSATASPAAAAPGRPAG